MKRVKSTDLLVKNMAAETIIKGIKNKILYKNKVKVLKQNEDKIRIVTISGLGTGAGSVPSDICANQMKKAYDDVWLDKYIFPDTLRNSMKSHYSLITKINN